MRDSPSEAFREANYFSKAVLEEDLKQINFGGDAATDTRDGFEATLLEPGQDLLQVIPFCPAVFVYKAK